jgi:hypothetical protein
VKNGRDDDDGADAGGVLVGEVDDEEEGEGSDVIGCDDEGDEAVEAECVLELASSFGVDVTSV